MTSRVEEFLGAKTFAVAGASRDPGKYGYLVFRSLVDSEREVFPINPQTESIDGHRVFSSLSELPQVPEALSIITPPEITRGIILEAIEIGVQQIWMQPGAEDELSSQLARDVGINVIDDGSCILVALKLVVE